MFSCLYCHKPTKEWGFCSKICEKKYSEGNGNLYEYCECGNKKQKEDEVCEKCK